MVSSLVLSHCGKKDRLKNLSAKTQKRKPLRSSRFRDSIFNGGLSGGLLFGAAGKTQRLAHHLIRIAPFIVIPGQYLYQVAIHNFGH